MAAPLQSSMPQFTELGSNATVVLEALDPTSGAAVTGVVFSAVDLYVDITEPSTATQGSFAVGPYMLVPGPGA